VVEASEFLLNNNKFLGNNVINYLLPQEKKGQSGLVATPTEKRDEGETSLIGLRGRKNPRRDEKDFRRRKK